MEWGRWEWWVGGVGHGLAQALHVSTCIYEFEWPWSGLSDPTCTHAYRSLYLAKLHDPVRHAVGPLADEEELRVHSCNLGTEELAEV